MIHGDLKGQNIHIPYSFEYATSTARDAATGMTVNDEGKFCRILSDNTIWMLASFSPLTWVGVASGVGSGSTAVASSGVTFPPTPLNYEFFYRTDLDNVFIWSPIVSAWIDVTAANVSGDMFKLTYDPTNVNSNAFAMDSMIQGVFNLFISPAEKARIACSEVVTNKGISGGYASLDINSEVIQLPAGAADGAIGSVLRQDGQWVVPSVIGAGSVGISVYSQDQINTLIPTAGLTVFNSTIGKLQVYVASSGRWEKIKFDLGVASRSATFLTTSSMVLDSTIHQFIEVVANSSEVVITLPDPVLSNGIAFTIKVTDLTFGITVDVSNGGLIDIFGVYTFQNTGESITILSDGLEWELVASYNDVRSSDIQEIQQEIAHNTYNIAMNSFKLASIDSLFKMNLSDGVIDTYSDLVDITSTSEYNYNPGNSSLSNFTANAVVVDPGLFETIRPSTNIASSNNNPTGSMIGNTFKISGDGNLTSIRIPAFKLPLLNTTGSNTVDFIVFRLPIGQYIENATDKPLYSYISNHANQLGKVTLTEAQLSILLSSTIDQLDPMTWLNIVFPSPIFVTSGEFGWILKTDTINPIPLGSYAVNRHQNKTYEFGHMIQVFPSGMGTTFNATFTILNIIEMESSNTDINVSAELPKENVSLVALRLIPNTHDEIIAGTFRVSSFCDVTSIRLPLFMNSLYGTVPLTGNGDLKIGIRPVEFGRMSSVSSYARLYSSDNTLHHTISDIATITLTRAQIVAALPTFASDTAAISDMIANGFGFTASFPSPISLPPGEYGWYIDKRTNHITENISYIASNNPKDFTKSDLLRLNINGTALKTEHPLYEIVGKYRGVSTVMLIESTSQTALAVPTVIYYSGIVASNINSSTGLRVSVSRDNGTTWVIITTSEMINQTLVGTKMVYGSADVSAQPIGTLIKYKVETINGASATLMASSIQWR